VAVVQGIRVSKGTAADMTAHLAELRYGRDAVMALEEHPVVDLLKNTLWSTSSMACQMSYCYMQETILTTTSWVSTL